jgi:hypothetical protein
MLNLNAGVEETPQTPNPTAQAKIRKKIGTVPKIVFGAALLLVIPLLGNTLAGTITINNVGGKVEFGQGIAQTVACDSDGVTISPAAAYDSTTARFNISSITVSGINLSDSATACAGKTFKLYVVDTASALANYVTASINNMSVTANSSSAGWLSTTAGTGTALSKSTGNTTSESFTATISLPIYSAGDVSKIIIQSS